MIRVKVRLDEDECELAKAGAATLGISLAEFIRRAIRVQLGRPQIRPWMHYAGFIETGNPRSSTSIDEIVYGSKH